MNSLEKFNQVLKKLDTETQNLKEIGKTYKKIEALCSEYTKINDKATKNNDTLSEILNLQEQERKKISESITQIEQERIFFQKEFTQIIQRSFETITSLLKEVDDNRKLYQTELTENITSSLKEVDDNQKLHQAELTKTIESEIDTLSKNNKELYQDWEKDLRIKLENYKSEIKQLIEYERNQIRQIFEIEFSKAVKTLSETIQNESQSIRKKQNTDKNFILFFCFVIILLCAFIIYKVM